MMTNHAAGKGGGSGDMGVDREWEEKRSVDYSHSLIFEDRNFGVTSSEFITPSFCITSE